MSEYNLLPHYIFTLIRPTLPPINECDNLPLRLFKGIEEKMLDSRLKLARNKDENEYWDEVKFLNTKKENLWAKIKPELYCIFWYLSIDDLKVDLDAYATCLKEIKDKF